ncbi:unnamed protein product [Strongylus vulgaris]|uniref:Uncharacterized protein n=1 Tax=Strongylus vulgaris TaxID=40348 RepID=A0A3P7JVH8_STRVU|nr:unnamed protein product [Strongylus vulgaris]
MPEFVEFIEKQNPKEHVSRWQQSTKTGTRQLAATAFENAPTRENRADGTFAAGVASPPFSFCALNPRMSADAGKNNEERMDVTEAKQEPVEDVKMEDGDHAEDEMEAEEGVLAYLPLTFSQQQTVESSLADAILQRSSMMFGGVEGSNRFKDCWKLVLVASAQRIL